MSQVHKKLLQKFYLIIKNKMIEDAKIKNKKKVFFDEKDEFES